MGLTLAGAARGGVHYLARYLEAVLEDLEACYPKSPPGGLPPRLGASLRSKGWLSHLVARPERHNLFRLARIALARGPLFWQEAVVAELDRSLRK